MGRPNGHRRDVRRFAVRPMLPADAAAVLTIYQRGLAGGDASFDTRAPDWATFDNSRLPEHRFVAMEVTTDGDAEPGTDTGTDAGEVRGWIAVTPVSARPVYAGVVEHSVYVDPAAAGQGIGRRLLDTLITSTERAGIWTIQSGVFPENTASLALHARAGFRTVGMRERIGCHNGRWRDVILLERRSPHVR